VPPPHRSDVSSKHTPAVHLWVPAAEAMSVADDMSGLGEKNSRDIATEHELTPKQMHKLMTIWRQYLKATPVPGKARQR